MLLQINLGSSDRGPNQTFACLCVVDGSAVRVVRFLLFFSMILTKLSHNLFLMCDLSRYGKLVKCQLFFVLEHS